MERRRVDLTVRAGQGDTVLVRASNDQIVDHYGTVITAEALMRDWWAGYQQHRTVSLQHNIPKLRDIEGKANIGRAVRVDFTPQLEVELQVLDPEVTEKVRSGKIGSASLEFVPVEAERRSYAGQDDAEVYHRLSPEPEHTGLSLVDVPGVPGADVLALRSLPALWAYAVVDPLVLNGEITDPERVRQLAWLPHHDERSHSVDETQLRQALEDLESGRITIPPFASLTAAQVADRARAHLERHTLLGLGRSQRARPHKEGQMNEWIRARAAQLVAEGVTQAEAEKQAREAYKALSPEVRAKIEGATDDTDDSEQDESRGLFSRLFGRSNVTVNVNEAPRTVETRTEPEASQEETEDEEGDDEDTGEGLDERIDQRVQERLAELAGQPENPMAAIASGIRVRSGRMEPEQLLTEVLTRTVLKQIERKPISSQDRVEVDNMLAAHGIDKRALTIEGNGTVIYEELARIFSVKPSPTVVFRNHIRSLPMNGAKKIDFPRFDRSGLSFAWNRPNQGGSTSQISPSDPTLDTFPIEVSELNGATVVADSFLHFNASGARFVGEYLLPEFRGAAQAAEDRAFWLGNGSHPAPASFKGLREATGITEANSGHTAKDFSEDVLNDMLRAMPAEFRADPSRLAYYLPLERADDFAEIRAARATALGDAYAQDRATIPGPASVGRYRGIDVYGIAQLPTNETVGGGTDKSTAYLVYRPALAIGDGLTLRIETHRQPGFLTRIELQEFVGLGYEWPTAVVRHTAIGPKASS